MDYKTIYDKLCFRGQNRKVCKDKYYEIHHIVPRCMGGANVPENLTTLTAREHFICHKLLCKIYPDNYKLKWAVVMMCNTRTRESCKVTSRDYESSRLFVIENNKRLGILKRGKKYPNISKSKIGFKFSEESRKKMSESQKNIPEDVRAMMAKSQKNKCWITDGLKDKRYPIGLELPAGFIFGRSSKPSADRCKAHAEFMRGRFVGDKNPSAKSVLQYDLSYNFIAEYPTIRDAEKATGIRANKISKLCTNKIKNKTKFIFKFKGHG